MQPLVCPGVDRASSDRFPKEIFSAASRKRSAPSAPDARESAMRLPSFCLRSDAPVMWSACTCVSSVQASRRPSSCTSAASRRACSNTGSISTASRDAASPSRYVYVDDCGSNSCRKIIWRTLHRSQRLPADCSSASRRCGCSRRTAASFASRNEGVEGHRAALAFPGEGLDRVQQPAREDVEVPDLRLEADEGLRQALLAADEEGDVARAPRAEVAAALFLALVGDVLGQPQVQHPRDVAGMEMHRAEAAVEMAHHPEVLEAHLGELAVVGEAQVARDPARGARGEGLLAAIEEEALLEAEVLEPPGMRRDLRVHVAVDALDQARRGAQTRDHRPEGREEVHRAALRQGLARARGFGGLV